MTPENLAKKEIKSFLNTLAPDLYYFAQPAGPHSSAGVADIVCCFRGKFLAIEVKSAEAYKKEGHNLSEAQKNFRSSIALAGSEMNFLCACNARQVEARIACLRA